MGTGSRMGSPADCVGFAPKKEPWTQRLLLWARFAEKGLVTGEKGLVTGGCGLSVVG